MPSWNNVIVAEIVRPGSLTRVAETPGRKSHTTGAGVGLADALVYSGLASPRLWGSAAMAVDFETRLDATPASSQSFCFSPPFNHPAFSLLPLCVSLLSTASFALPVSMLFHL